MLHLHPPSPTILAYLKQWEGFRSTPYQCPAGLWTVGYGHVIREGENIPALLLEEEAETLLLKDLAHVSCALARHIHVPLTPNQYDALLSFTFNVGAGALQRSTLRRKVNRCEHEDIPHEFNRWVWTGGRKLQGLILRRQLEGRIYAGTAMASAARPSR